MKIFTIVIEGKKEGDIELAAEEVLRLIREGYTSGMNSNSTSRFHFENSGDYEPSEPEDPEQTEVLTPAEHSYSLSCTNGSVYRD